MKKSLLFLLVAVGLVALTAPVWAETRRGSNTDRVKKDVNITCLANAVNAREVSLGTAISTHSSTMNTAYATRATALKNAYNNTDRKVISAAVKTAWDNFNKTSQEASKTWKKSRDAAWKTFRTSAATCRVSVSVVDANKSINEVAGE